MKFKLPLIGAMVVGLAVAAEGAAAADNPQIALDTSLGKIVLELYPEKAPNTVANFLQYVDDGHYSDTIFHRVIGSFMIQGGGFTAELYKSNLKTKDTRAPIELEAKNGLKNDLGWIAMARTADPNSATAQFFINTSNNDSLNYPSPDGHGYAVFGKVVDGMDVVTAIAGVATGTLGPMRDVPSEPVHITGASRVAK